MWGLIRDFVGARPDDSRVNPENIVKLKRNMHNGLSIYQTKYCKTTFLALSLPAYPTC